MPRPRRPRPVTVRRTGQQRRTQSGAVLPRRMWHRRHPRRPAPRTAGDVRQLQPRRRRHRLPPAPHQGMAATRRTDTTTQTETLPAGENRALRLRVARRHPLRPRRQIPQNRPRDRRDRRQDVHPATLGPGHHDLPQRTRRHRRARLSRRPGGRRHPQPRPHLRLRRRERRRHRRRLLEHHRHHQPDGRQSVAAPPHRGDARRRSHHRRRQRPGGPRPRRRSRRTVGRGRRIRAHPATRPRQRPHRPHRGRWHVRRPPTPGPPRRHRRPPRRRARRATRDRLAPPVGRRHRRGMDHRTAAARPTARRAVLRAQGREVPAHAGTGGVHQPWRTSPRIDPAATVPGAVRGLRERPEGRHPVTVASNGLHPRRPRPPALPVVPHAGRAGLRGGRRTATHGSRSPPTTARSSSSTRSAARSRATRTRTTPGWRSTATPGWHSSRPRWR